MNALGAALVVVVACAGCEKSSAPAPPAPSASAPAAPLNVAPAASASAQPNSLFTGEWSGTYQARQYRIEMTKPQGAVKNWAEDTGKEHAGQGKLSLRIAGDDSVSGSSSGPLGELNASGALDGDVLRVRLTPVTATERAFSGWLLAKREGEMLKGRLQAGSGDSYTVRDAPVELRRSRADSASPAPSAAVR